ncbi:hypothetical protein [Streptomyces rubiginosohelvolus]|uniref:hypothetical protein n=1 Tax=Streptomyces rubiginosohelvolus TaxID=67362 RepID=UPI0037D7F5A4
MAETYHCGSGKLPRRDPQYLVARDDRLHVVPHPAPPSTDRGFILPDTREALLFDAVGLLGGPGPGHQPGDAIGKAS